MKKENFVVPELIIVNLNEEVILSSGDNNEWTTGTTYVDPDYP